MQQPLAQLILTFALGAATLHGGWLCLLFFLKKGERLLAVVLASATVYLLNYLLFLTEIVRTAPDFLGWLFPFIFLTGAAFYFFVKKSLVPGFRFRAIHLLHLLPFVFGWWQMLPVLSMPPERKKVLIEWLLDPKSEYSTGQILMGNLHVFTLLGYVVAAWFFSKKMENEAEIIENQSKARWHRRFCEFFALLLLIDLSVKISFNLLGISAVLMEYLLAGLFACTLHLLGYHTLGRVENFPKILPGTNGNGKYRTSPLTAQKLESGKNVLLILMENEKPWLNPELKINDLAERLGLPSHHLSQVLNEKIGRNFNDFVNGYRVEAVKKELAAGKHHQLSLEAVGLDCGFSNKTTFNRVFKKMTGCTPGAFLEKQEEAG